MNGRRCPKCGKPCSTSGQRKCMYCGMELDGTGASLECFWCGGEMIQFSNEEYVCRDCGWRYKEPVEEDKV